VKSISLNALSHETFLSVTTVQQLDIFADSRDVALRNDVVEQLQRCDAAAAPVALTLLAREYATDSALPAMTVLVRELENASTRPMTDHSELATICHRFENKMASAARQVLPEQSAQSWMRPCWHELAQRGTALLFRASDPDSHAAPLWLRAGEWSAASDAVNTIDSWWRFPSTIAWMCEARYRAAGVDVA
jgi:hypothetical protein